MKPRVLVPFLFLLMPIARAQVYTITDLGRLSPTAINSWGQVAGNYNGHAFIWTRMGSRDLGIIPGGTFSYAAAINDRGTVAGTADGPGTVVSLEPGVPNQQCSNLTQPFIWTRHGGIHGLGTVADNVFYAYSCTIPFYATGANVPGQVVGYTPEFASFEWGLLWTRADGMSLFGGSWPPTFAKAISDNGEIVGQNSIYFTYDIGHATSWKNGVTTDLGTFGGVDVLYASMANGVNDLGQVVGWSTTTFVSMFDGCYIGDDTTCPMHAALWMANGTIRDLGTLPGDTLSAALKINLFGHVIGSSGNTLVRQVGGQDSSGGMPQVIGRPFIWSERRGMRDLNTLIRSNSGWVLNSASDINVWGQIVGEGVLNGQPHGFLLTPLNPFQL